MMRNFVVYVWSFFFVLLVGCSGMDSPVAVQPTSSATSSRISLEGGGGSASGDEEEEGTVVFNDHLKVSSGGLVNPIPALLDRQNQEGVGHVDQDADVAYDGDVWPEEILNPVNAPEPDAVVDTGNGVDPDDVVEVGGVDPDDVVDVGSSDDGLVPDVIDPVSDDSGGGGDGGGDADSGDDDDIWGEVVD